MLSLVVDVGKLEIEVERGSRRMVVPGRAGGKGKKRCTRVQYFNTI